MHNLHSNERVMQYTSTQGTIQSLEESKEELDRIILSYDAAGTTFRVWGIERKSDGDFVGTCALIGEDNDLGYRIREKHWGRGYASEVALGLIRYAFDVLGLENLVAVADARNLASVRILEKNMHFVKTYYNQAMDCTDRLYQLPKE